MSTARDTLAVHPLVDLADEYISGAHRDSTVAQRPTIIRDFVKWVVARGVSSLRAPQGGPPGAAIYVASKSFHAPIWREMRDHGAPIISTWIDEAGPGETKDRADLWRRCVAEASRCSALILFGEKADTLRGALVEVGAALAHNRPVIVFGSAPRWTFEDHPRVLRVDTKEQALRAALTAGELGGAGSGAETPPQPEIPK